VLRATRVFAVAALVSGLCASTALPANAKTPPHRGPVKAFGMIIAVNGSTADGACGVAGAAGTFTLLGRNTSQTVIHVGAGTHYFLRHRGPASFANVCVNGLAGAQGRVSNGVFNANQVKVWAPKPPPTVSLFGIVVSVNGSSADGACGTLGGNGTFTIMNRRAAQKVVNVTTSTAYFARGIPSPTFANVCVDEMVGATGTRENGAVTATDVMIWSPVPDDFSAFGMVISVNGSSATGACGVAGASGTFTVLRRNASQTIVNVSPATTFVMKDVTSPTFANVCVNEMVGSHGPVSNGALDADRVRIFARPGFPPVSAFGMVLSVNGSTAAGACGTSGATGTFTIIKRNASRTIVDVTSTTKFRPKGKSFADVCVNGMVGAAGNVSGTDLVADVVRIHAAPGSA